jgi:aspartate/tyrosine/aromatic aminotransferase
MYSSPPIHGAAIVVKVLSDPQLLGLWRQELAAMSRRIQDMRVALKQALIEVCGGDVVEASLLNRMLHCRDAWRTIALR